MHIFAFTKMVTICWLSKCFCILLCSKYMLRCWPMIWRYENCKTCCKESFEWAQKKVDAIGEKMHDNWKIETLSFLVCFGIGIDIVLYIQNVFYANTHEYMVYVYVYTTFNHIHILTNRKLLNIGCYKCYVDLTV